MNTTGSPNSVFLGGIKANVVTGWSTSLSFPVPAGGTYQPISVLNTSNGLTGYSSKPFVITADIKGNFTTSDIDPKVDFTTGYSPSAVCMADIDGDGKLDIAVLNSSSIGYSVSIFRNTAIKGELNASSLAAKITITTGNAPSAIALQDMDGDGKPDLIVLNKQDNTVSVFHNNATSGTINSTTFGAMVNFTTSVTPTNMAIGDIDGDGKPDIVISNHAVVSVFLNQSVVGSISAASFAAKTDLNFRVTSFVVADIDNDGRMDIVGLNSSTGNIAIFHYISTTAGSVSTASFDPEVPIPASQFSSSLTVADLTNSGKLDILVANGTNNNISVFQNAVSGGVVNQNSFLSAVTFATAKFPYSISVGDIDGDGLPEILVPNYSAATFTIFHNTYTSGNINTSTFAGKIDLAMTASSFPSAIVTGDIDGDGYVDIAATNSINIFSLFRNDPIIPPAITSISPMSGPVGTVVTITGTNFNKKSLANNVVYFGATKAVITSATANQIIASVPVGATYSPITVINTETERAAKSIGSFDVTYNSKRSILTSDFATPPYGGYVSQHQLTVDIIDIDGDGKPDMVTGDLTAKTVSVWLNTGTVNSTLNGQFAPAVTFDGGDAITALKIADVDGDGKPDIVTINSTHIISVLHNISTPGNAMFDKRNDVITFPDYYYIDRIEMVDINMDGKPDIVAWSYGGSDFYVFKNTSLKQTMSFSAPSTFYANIGSTVQIGDIDGDGKPDITLTVYDPYGNSPKNGISKLRHSPTI